MKYLDLVKLKVDKPKYNKFKVYKDMEGMILEPEIRFGQFLVQFYDENGHDLEDIPVEINDLEVTDESNLTDEDIIEDLGFLKGHGVCIKVIDGLMYDEFGQIVNKHCPYTYVKQKKDD